jgi:hypothetical protein
MGGNVISLIPTFEVLNCMPEWFREVYRKPVVYHRDCLIDFKLVRDDTRFAGGIAWFCRKCNIEAFCYEEYIREKEVFSVFLLHCHGGCKNTWRMDDIEPYLESIYEFPFMKRTERVEVDIMHWISMYLRIIPEE